MLTACRGLIALVLCLAPLAAHPAETPAPLCRLPRLGKIEPILDHGRILIPARLNGTDVRFLFTNATDSWVRADIAETLGMGRTPLAPELHIFVGGSRSLRERRTGALELGGLHWQDFAFLPSPAGYQPIGDVAGTIGADAFVNAGVDLEFDLAHDAINVIAPNACAAPPWSNANGASPVSLGEEGVVFSVMLDGERFRAVIAPALAQTRIFSIAARHQFHLFPKTQIMDPDVHGPAILLPRRFAVLEAKGFRLDGIDVAVVRQFAPPPWRISPPLYPFVVEPLDLEWFAAFDPVPSADEPADLLMLGGADLRRLRLYFAFGRHEVFVAPSQP